MIAVLAAKEEEVAVLKDQLASPVEIYLEHFLGYNGFIDGKEVVVLRTGAGPKNSRIAVDNLLDYCHPEIILSVGWAGGATREISQGDVIVANIIYCGYNEALPPIRCDKNLYNKALNALNGFCSGGSLTVSHPLLLPEEKRTAGKKYPVVMVEMESYEIALATKRENVPFLTIRVITDPVESVATLAAPRTNSPTKRLNEAVISFIKAV